MGFIAPPNASETEWLDIPGYDGQYQITSTGRVRSRDKRARCAHGGTRVFPGRELSVMQRPDGYKFVKLTGKDGVSSTQYLHRLLLLTFCGEPQEGYYGCHNDGNPENNSLSNLRWDSPTGNSHDTLRHGTHNNASKDKCRRGHFLSGENLERWDLKKGRRKCKACHLGSAFIRSRGLPIEDMQRVSDSYYEKIMGG